MMKVLVPTAGSPPARHSAEYIVRIASKLKADIVVLHVSETTDPEPEATKAFDIFVDAAAEMGLNVQSLIQKGSVVDTIISVAEKDNFALIIMGASEGVTVDDWISSKILHTSQLPVVVIPHTLATKGRKT